MENGESFASEASEADADTADGESQPHLPRSFGVDSGPEEACLFICPAIFLGDRGPEQALKKMS